MLRSFSADTVGMKIQRSECLWCAETERLGHFMASVSLLQSPSKLKGRRSEAQKCEAIRRFGERVCSSIGWLHERSAFGVRHSPGQVNAPREGLSDADLLIWRSMNCFLRARSSNRKILPQLVVRRIAKMTTTEADKTKVAHRNHVRNKWKYNHRETCFSSDIH